VRELLNTVQRAYVSCPGAQIMPNHICFFDEMGSSHKINSQAKSFRSAKQDAIEIFERAYIQELIARHQGNVTQAAREAGKERRAFGRLLKKYGFNDYPSPGDVH
jgi:two-component system response regulator GlrR